MDISVNGDPLRELPMRDDDKLCYVEDDEVEDEVVHGIEGGIGVGGTDVTINRGKPILGVADIYATLCTGYQKVRAENIDTKDVKKWNDKKGNTTYYIEEGNIVTEGGMNTPGGHGMAE